MAATTNFTRLLSEEKTVWSRDVWTTARNRSFANRFMGTDEMSMIQRITELTESERGARAVITLVPELVEDGTVGDNTLEGNEEEIKAHDKVIQIDMLRHANKGEGKMAQQKTVVNFREQSKRVLAYWLSDRMDQMALLTLAGVAYTQKNTGAARVGSNLNDLSFAADVTAASTNRHFNWNQGTSTFDAGNTATVEADDDPSYEMLVRLKALLKTKYIKPIRGEGDNELYHIFLDPKGMAALRLDSDFLTNVRNAMPRAMENPLFKGVAAFNSVFVDGFAIHEHRHVFNTTTLTDTVDKWGSSANVEGCAMTVCGAQALGFADIGVGDWVEKRFDYDNQPGISYGKIMGYLKPVFESIYEATPSDEDFGVMRINVATYK
jgi:N4-gp56 family major capsid protein